MSTRTIVVLVGLVLLAAVHVGAIRCACATDDPDVVRVPRQEWEAMKSRLTGEQDIGFLLAVYLDEGEQTQDALFLCEAERDACRKSCK
jgi:hypothetical protein